MKKKIIFVIPSLDAGGAEKALVNLLNILPINEYSIDLLLFKKQGIFLEQVPNNVKVLNPEGDFPIFTQSLVDALKRLFKQKKWALIWARFQYAFSLKRYSQTAIAEQQSWKYWAKAIPVQDKEYDVAIAFLEKSSIYYAVDKVKAKKKIGWVHNDYPKLGLDPKFDISYFKRLDEVVTVSENCVQSFKQSFPSLENNIRCIYNVTSKKLIEKLSRQEDSVNSKQKINIVSIGRLTSQKGFDIGIEAFSKLPKAVLENIKWIIIGEGEDRNLLERKIENYNLKSIIELIGLTPNPYPFLKNATIYFQPSRYEGKSIALDEAKLLAKPILVTNFDTVYDQIEHLKTGFIVKQTPEAIAEGIIELFENEDLRNALEQNLKDFIINEEVVLKQFNQLLYD